MRQQFGDNTPPKYWMSIWWTRLTNRNYGIEDMPSQARTLIRLFERYHWKEVAVVYYSARSDVIPRCSLIVDDLEALMNDNPNMTMTYRRQISNFTNATFKNVLQAIREVSRITVICLESPEARRSLLIAIAEESMDTKEYMWLMVESRRLGFGEAWKDTKAVPDGKDSLALRAAQKFLVIDSEPLNASAQFIDDIKAKMRQPPYNCPDCESIDPEIDLNVLKTHLKDTCPHEKMFNEVYYFGLAPCILQLHLKQCS
ncbi:unnamed protein product [Haemonchus placei]|uniref:ANF_receptor domain-containing protein n=1 Tax=Haemonchus placei TaxID=6290 RepID=A0A0N4X725_HAEPC|nr:unnamed protein product [Haemonchus placei]